MWTNSITAPPSRGPCNKHTSLLEPAKTFHVLLLHVELQLLQISQLQLQFLQYKLEQKLQAEQVGLDILKRSRMFESLLALITCGGAAHILQP